ncbi:MAG: 5-(carboxyamino)imidazole ribonucleotide synthase [Pseudomonadota bacterium]
MNDTALARPTGPLRANDTIGIIGGGQLGRLLAMAAAKLGFRTVVLEPQEACPAAQVCNGQIVAAYDDEKALHALSEACDVVTYEFENVPLDAAQWLETSLPLFPPSKALAISQDRLEEKRALQEMGMDVARFRAVRTVDDLVQGLEMFTQGVLKTCRFGYDGKGQHVFCGDFDRREGSLHGVLESLIPEGSKAAEYGCVLEELVPFEKEFSIIGTRGLDGVVQCYPPGVNMHEDGILRRSSAGASLVDEALAAKGQQQVEQLLHGLDYVGTVGVEFFAVGGNCLVNEIAPRVHNTGHWTVEACATSQFEQHIRAIAGLPLGSVSMLYRGCEMENLLGEESGAALDFLQDPHVHLTLYGKAEARPGRKMGHITRVFV